MKRTMFALLLLVGVGCARPAPYVSSSPPINPCSYYDENSMEYFYCLSDQVRSLNEQGFANHRRAVRRQLRKSAFFNPYLRFDDLLDAHERSDASS
jgi:hypothetical protein